MPIKLKLSLQQKIIVYSLVVLSPVVLLAYFLVGENSSYVKQNRLDSISTRATLVRLSVDESIDGTIRFLENLAQSPIVRNGDRQAVAGHISDILPLYPNFTTLGIVDRDGQIVAAAQKGGTYSLTIADRLYFQEVLKTGRPAVSGRLFGRVTDQPVFVVVVPISDSFGRVSGAVTAGISLRQIQQRLERLGKEAGDAIIVDSEGSVLSHPNWSYVADETSFRSLAPIEQALAGKKGTAEFVDPLDGGHWLWAYQPLEKASWAVVVRYPASAVYSPFYYNLVRWFLFLLAAIAVALIFASFYADKITEPLQRFVKRIATAAPAGSIEKLPQANLDGLQEMANIFHRICSTLAQTAEELAEVKGELAEQAMKLDVLTQKAIGAREEERRRIAMNIHDGVLQLIAAAQGGTRLAYASASSRPDVAANRLRHVEMALEQALSELREMAHGIQPPSLEEAGLAQAIYYHLVIWRELFGVPRFTLLVLGDACRLDPETEIAAFRIVQEALSNVGKHAGAAHADLLLEYAPACLRIVVADDGQGFDSRAIGGASDLHCGLANMRERARAIGGRCVVLSIPGEGTRVEVEIPLPSPKNDVSALLASAMG